MQKAADSRPVWLRFYELVQLRIDCRPPQYPIAPEARALSVAILQGIKMQYQLGTRCL